MSEGESGKWTFQRNIVGLTLLLFASGYIGQHTTVLVSVSGWPRVMLHYLGELVLTFVAVGCAFWRAYGTSELHRERIAWLERSALWFYVGLGAVLLNVILLTAALVLGKLG
ncbi:hypothetical protein AYO44_13605 [Planctomycetaceae bacterium SCGC AG-212-F19]|nr:hypothetical protein AYO44_13605 [Planctomycetaceae bacterium SCGC AG-212-F19]